MNKAFLRRWTLRAGTLIVLETCLISAAVIVSAYLRFGDDAIAFVEYDWHRWLLIALVAQVCLYYADLYDLQVISDRRELFVRAVHAAGQRFPLPEGERKRIVSERTHRLLVEMCRLGTEEGTGKTLERPELAADPTALRENAARFSPEIFPVSTQSRRRSRNRWASVPTT